MSIEKIISVLLLILVIFSNEFGLTPPTARANDDAPFTAKVNDTILDSTALNHVTLPATIVFTANKPLTVYYTTNGSDPTTSTTYTKISSAKATVIGPTITSTEYMLLMQGVDETGNLTPLMLYSFVTP